MKYETSAFNRQTKDLMWKYNRKAAERHQFGLRIANTDYKFSTV